MTGSELAASGDWDGSARTASGAGGAGVRGEGVGSGAGFGQPASDSPALSEGVGGGAGFGRPASDSLAFDGPVGSGAELGGAGSDSLGPSPDLEDDAALESDGADEPDRFDEPDDLDLGGGYRVRPFWARTSTLVVVVVVLFLLSGAVTAWLRISDLQDRVDSLEAQALAADEGRQAAVPLAEDLASYDYRDLGGNFRLVKASATPHFAGQLRQLSEELGPQLQQTRAVATATVRSAGVVRATATSVVVAVFVDQTVTNTKTPTPRTERSRMELTLLKQGGVWRLDQAGEL